MRGRCDRADVAPRNLRYSGCSSSSSSGWRSSNRKRLMTAATGLALPFSYREKAFLPPPASTAALAWVSRSFLRMRESSAASSASTRSRKASQAASCSGLNAGKPSWQLSQKAPRTSVTKGTPLYRSSVFLTESARVPSPQMGQGCPWYTGLIGRHCRYRQCRHPPRRRLERHCRRSAHLRLDRRG